MRTNELLCRPQKRWVRTTQSDHGYPLYPNLLKDRPITAINQAWVSDITYIRITSSFVYLSVLLDLFSRKAIGYAVSQSLHASLTLQALGMALSQRDPPRGCIHHSDQGVQYACDQYQQILGGHGMICSMSRRGNCYDNAPMESFFASLKTEWVYHRRYLTRAEAVQSLFEYIEVFYNRTRRHSALGFVSPVDYEAAMN